MICVQHEDFSVGEEYEQLHQQNVTGAIVTFVGRVREFSATSNDFFLQHYPGMTEKVLTKIETEAHARWPLNASKIIHRVGQLALNDQIVFIGVSSAHRKAAFDACEYMIDILKTQAPFWKKEGEHWVDAKSDDQDAACAWLAK